MRRLQSLTLRSEMTTAQSSAPARHCGAQPLAARLARRLPTLADPPQRRAWQIKCTQAAQRRSRVASGAAAEAAGAAPPVPWPAEPVGELPFFPDRRCAEDVQLPPLSACHHYVNLTNGIEAIPRLQQLGLPYRFLRLPSTRCEQQQFEALLNDLDSDLLMRLALGQCCLVYDFGSRNKRRGAPRAVWYGLEFVRYALRRLWLGERGAAYLRGYNVQAQFEEHVRGLSGGTKKKLRYYQRFLPPVGLPRLHLYGVYAPTSNDGDKAMYAALLRGCEQRLAAGANGGNDNSSGGMAEGMSLAAGSRQGQQQEEGKQQAAAGDDGPASQSSQQQQQEQQQMERQIAAVLQAGAAPLAGVPPGRRAELLHSVPAHVAAEELLGMRLFLGGVSHDEFFEWVERSGFQLDGKGGASRGSSRRRSGVEL